MSRILTVAAAVLSLGLGACSSDDGTKSEDGDITFNSDSLQPGDDGYLLPDGATPPDQDGPGDDTEPGFDVGDADLFVEPGGPGNEEFPVNSYTMEDQKNPNMALMSDGSFVIVWQSGKNVSTAPQDGSGWGVIAKHFRKNGAPYADEFVVPTTTQGSQTRPAVAGRPDGAYWVLWEGEGLFEGSLKDIGAKAFDLMGEVLANERRLNAKVDSNQTQPAAFVNARGDLIAIWQSDGSVDGSSDGIYGQHYLGGLVMKGADYRVNSYTKDSQRDPSLGFHTDGSFVVAWTSEGQDNGIGNGVFAQRYTDAVAGTGEFVVNSELVGQQEKPDVAFLPDGRFVLVWQSFPGQDGDGSGIFGQIFSQAGTKVGAEFRLNEVTAGQQTQPRIAGLPDGGYVVVWQSCPNTDSGIGGDGNDCGIIGRRFSGDTPVTGDFVVNQTTAGVQEAPRILSLGDGAFVVVWNSIGQDLASEPKGYGLFARRFPIGFKP